MGMLKIHIAAAAALAAFALSQQALAWICMPGLDELWELTGRYLKQTEFDGKGKKVKGYGAIPEVTR